MSRSHGRTSESDFDLDSALAALAGRKSLLIYTHDNPDPDSLAAALGLGRLAQHELGVTVTAAHGGIVGRAQNRAMVENLKMQLTPVERIDTNAFDTIALVDSQPETGNNSLPPGHRIDIVIDHHPPRPGSARAPWCDIRPDLGATSTIVFEYLRRRAVPIDTPLATAFFFALRTETRDLGRESTEAERRAYLALVPLVDHALLYRINHPKVPRAHFAALDRALRSALVFGDARGRQPRARSATRIWSPRSPTCCCRTRGRDSCCAWASTKTNPYMSLRTEADNARAGTVMRTVVAARRRRRRPRHDGRREAVRDGQLGAGAGGRV